MLKCLTDVVPYPTGLKDKNLHLTSTACASLWTYLSLTTPLSIAEVNVPINCGEDNPPRLCLVLNDPTSVK